MVSLVAYQFRPTRGRISLFTLPLRAQDFPCGVGISTHSLSGLHDLESTGSVSVQSLAGPFIVEVSFRAESARVSKTSQGFVILCNQWPLGAREFFRPVEVFTAAVAPVWG